MQYLRLKGYRDWLYEYHDGQASGLNDVEVKQLERWFPEQLSVHNLPGTQLKTAQTLNK